MMNDNSNHHFDVVDLSNDERDHILTSVMTLEHTPIPTIYCQTTFPRPGLTPPVLNVGPDLALLKEDMTT